MKDIKNMTKTVMANYIFIVIFCIVLGVAIYNIGYFWGLQNSKPKIINLSCDKSAIRSINEFYENGLPKKKECIYPNLGNNKLI